MPAQPRSRLQRAALFACVGTLVGPSTTLFSSSQQLSGLMDVYPDFAWFLVAFGICMVAWFLALPIFSFALYLTPGGITVSLGHRKLAYGTALLAAVLLSIRVIQWLVSLPQGANPFDLWISVGDVLIFAPMTFGGVVLGALSTIASILLLNALARHAFDDRHPASKFLVASAKTATVVWGLAVAASVIRLAILPYAYSTAREQLAALPTPPTFLQMYGEPVQLMLELSTMFVAPWIVLKSLGGHAEPEAANSQVPQPL